METSNKQKEDYLITQSYGVQVWPAMTNPNRYKVGNSLATACFVQDSIHYIRFNVAKEVLMSIETHDLQIEYSWLGCDLIMLNLYEPPRNLLASIVSEYWLRNSVTYAVLLQENATDWKRKCRDRIQYSISKVDVGMRLPGADRGLWPAFIYHINPSGISLATIHSPRAKPIPLLTDMPVSIEQIQSI